MKILDITSGRSTQEEQAKWFAVDVFGSDEKGTTTLPSLRTSYYTKKAPGYFCCYYFLPIFYTLLFQPTTIPYISLHLPCVLSTTHDIPTNILDHDCTDVPSLPPSGMP